MKSYFEQNGGTYTKVGDYYLPDLTLPEEPEYHIGVWGMLRQDYLKKHRKGLYTILLTKGKLSEHLHEIDVAAFERRELIINQMKEAHGVTEKLKSEDCMKWIGMVTNICACADEIIRNDLIYS